jgi:hypothetical protein
MHSDVSAKKQLLTMDECLFYRLLEGPGKVEIDITRVGRYFVPFVTFLADDQAPRIHYGAIVRNKTDVLGAETVADLLVLLGDLSGGATNLKVVFCDASVGTVGPH